MLSVIVFSVCILSIVEVGVGVKDFNYCSIHPFNSLCLYKQRKRVDCLGHEFRDGQDHYVQSGRLSMEEKDKIMEAHNNLRQIVARGYLEQKTWPKMYLPKSKNMNELLWDDELELMAQAHADRCQNVMFDVNRDVDRFPVGQNIYSTCYTKHTNNFTIEEMIDVWAEPRYQMNILRFNGYSPRLEYRTDMRLYTFTQMIWGSLSYIGCARAVFKGKKLVPGTNVKVDVWINQFVCNYGPSGMESRQPIYAIGKPAKGCCGERKSEKYSDLCYPCI